MGMAPLKLVKINGEKGYKFTDALRRNMTGRWADFHETHAHLITTYKELL
jgi:hypothetical protein